MKKSMKMSHLEYKWDYLNGERNKKKYICDHKLPITQKSKFYQTTIHLIILYGNEYIRL